MQGCTLSRRVRELGLTILPMIHVVAWARKPGTGARDESPHKSRYVEADADSFGAAKEAVLAELADDWLVGSWRVEPAT